MKYLRDVVTLQLDVAACNGCGMCVTVCPHAVFDVKDRKAYFTDREACMECGACAINCPVNAIRVQTGAGCATGVLLGAIGIDSCCSSECGVSPASARSNQGGCCDPKIGNAGIVGSTSKEYFRTFGQRGTGATKNFIIYESAMCCPTGVCGSNPDNSLIDLQDALDKLKDMGAKVERYSITGNPKKFKDNPDVIKLMREHQIKALPITTYDGKVVKVGVYPSLAELKNMLQEGHNAEPLIKLNFRDDAECCSGKDSCDISCGPNYTNGNDDSARNCC